MLVCKVIAPLLLLLGTVVAVGGCGQGADADARVRIIPLTLRVTPVYTAPATATPHPTFTPVPAAIDGGVAPVGAVVGVAGLSVEPERLSCTGALRSELLGHDRDVYFEDVQQLVDGLRQGRVDCSEDQWPAEVSILPVCQQGNSIELVAVSRSLWSEASSRRNPQLGPTGGDARGNLLVHFSRLPGADEGVGGCWYYRETTGEWHVGEVATVEPEPTAVARGTALNCDAELRHVLTMQLRGADANEIQALVLEVKNGVEGCQGAGWGPLVAAVGNGPAAAGCGTTVRAVGAEASRIEPDGRVRLYWQSRGRPADGASCWAYDPDASGWSVGSAAAMVGAAR